MLKRTRLYIITALLINILMLHTAIADTCPDMSHASSIPSGWYLFTPTPSYPDSQNIFTKATYSYNANFFPNLMLCSYANVNTLGFFSLVSTSTYSQPSGPEWRDDRISDIVVCQGSLVTDCPF